MEEEMLREHFLLYYLFEEDKREHPMPPELVAAIRQRLFVPEPE